jgi:hypothetical protein
MRPQRFLRHLDQVIVPRLAGGLARVARGRQRVRLLTGGALLGATGVLLAVVWTAHRGTTAAADGALGETVRVGVVQGQSVPLYARQARSELASLLKRPSSTPVETYALVSLTAYLAPERLTPVLGGVSVVEVYARVPLERAATQGVRIPAFKIPDDVVAGMRQVARRKDDEAADFRGLAAKLTTAAAEEQRLRETYLGGGGIPDRLHVRLCRRGAGEPGGAGPDRVPSRGAPGRPGARGAAAGPGRLPASAAGADGPGRPVGAGFGRPER